MPRKLELGDGPGGGDAEHQIQRHRDGGGEQRQLDRRQRIGLDQARRDRRIQPLRSASANTAIKRQQQEDGEEAERRRRGSMHLHPGARSRVAALLLEAAPQPRAMRRCVAAIAAIRRTFAASALGPGLQPIDDQQQHERDDQHHRCHRRCAGIVVLLQLGDDDQRRDLGDHRHVAGDEDHRAVLADRAREGQREAGQQRRRSESAA